MAPYDPELTIHGEPVPFIHKEPMKFLGQLVYKDLSDTEVRKGVSVKLDSMLKLVDGDCVDGLGKLWIYEHMITAKLSWEFTIYCFPLSFGRELQAAATRHLKRWAGLTKTANNSVLFRSRKRGGLGITPLALYLKCMQVTKFHQLKYSIDSDTQLIYGHIANRLRRKKHWNGVIELEERERHLVLNDMCHGQTGRAGLGTSSWKPSSRLSPREHRKRIVELVKETDEEHMLIYVYSMAKQGRPLAWDAVMFLDTRWRELLYNMSDKLLSFYLNSISDTLPSPSNLAVWTKKNIGACSLCGYSNCSLFHILSNCRFSLTSGRYNWRDRKSVV